jgi:hypothetical protein
VNGHRPLHRRERTERHTWQLTTTHHARPTRSNEDSIEELKARRHDKNSGKVDEDEVEAAESFELPGADLSHEELSVQVPAPQEDEFTCASCFLVHHRKPAGDGRRTAC